MVMLLIGVGLFSQHRSSDALNQLRPMLRVASSSSYRTGIDIPPSNDTTPQASKVVPLDFNKVAVWIAVFITQLSYRIVS
jgi:hypothetical protein